MNSCSPGKSIRRLCNKQFHLEWDGHSQRRPEAVQAVCQALPDAVLHPELGCRNRRNSFAFTPELVENPQTAFSSFLVFGSPFHELCEGHLFEHSGLIAVSRIVNQKVPVFTIPTRNVTHDVGKAFMFPTPFNPVEKLFQIH